VTLTLDLPGVDAKATTRHRQPRGSRLGPDLFVNYCRLCERRMTVNGKERDSDSIACRGCVKKIRRAWARSGKTWEEFWTLLRRVEGR
jgi:hypothetical protein